MKILNKDNTGKKSDLKETILQNLYISFIVISSLTFLYFLFLNLMELIDLSLGENTFLSQRSRLTNNQVICYLILCIIILSGILILIFKRVLQEKRKLAILMSILLWLLLIADIFIEPLTYYPPI